MSNVANGADDLNALQGFDRAQADLHGELGAVPAAREEVEADAHGTRRGIRMVPRAVPGVSLLETIEQEQLDPPPQHLGARVAEHPLGLDVDEYDRPFAIYADDGIRHGIE
jgi:hypothetical protein